MKRKSKKELNPCEEKALVHLQALQIKEKEQKAKARAKKRKLDTSGTLTGQNLPYVPVTEPTSEIAPLSYFPRETAMPARDEWNQLIPAAVQTAQFMIFNHAMSRQGQWRQPQQVQQPQRRPPIVIPPRVPPNRRPLIELIEQPIERPVGPIRPPSDATTTAMNALRRAGGGIASVARGIYNVGGRIATGVGGLIDSAQASIALSKENKTFTKNRDIAFQDLLSAARKKNLAVGLQDLTQGPNTSLYQMLNEPVGPRLSESEDTQRARKMLRRELEKSRMEREDVNVAPQPRVQEDIIQEPRIQEDIIEEPRIQEDVIVSSHDLTQPAHIVTPIKQTGSTGETFYTPYSGKQEQKKQEEEKEIEMTSVGKRTTAGSPDDVFFTPRSEKQEEEKKQIEMTPVSKFSLTKNEEENEYKVGPLKQATAESLGSIGSKSPAAKFRLTNADGSVVVTESVKGDNITNSRNMVKFSLNNPNGEDVLKDFYNYHVNNPKLKKTLRVPRVGEIPYVKIDANYMLNQNGKVVSKINPQQLHPSYELESNPGAVRAIKTRITHDDVVNFLSDPDNVQQAQNFYVNHTPMKSALKGEPLQVTPAHELTSKGILKPVQSNIPYNPEEDTIFDNIEEDYGPGMFGDGEMEMTTVKL
jgi:hypothetical protein